MLPTDTKGVFFIKIITTEGTVGKKTAVE